MGKHCSKGDTLCPPGQNEDRSLCEEKGACMGMEKSKPKRITGCRAVQYGDTTKCESCSLVWDTNDPTPPDCKWHKCLDCGTFKEALGWTLDGRPVCSECVAIRDAAEAKRTAPPIAPDLLEAAAATFRERNAIYGNNYQRFGALLIALFPAEGIPPITTPGAAQRLDYIIMCLGKLQRYAHNFHRGGHQDSARDLTVYAAMLEEFTEEES